MPNSIAWSLETIDNSRFPVTGLTTQAAIAMLASALASIAIAACVVNPVTGKRELSIVSNDQAIELGIQQYQPSQQSQGGQYYLDPELTTYVNEVGQRADLLRLHRSLALDLNSIGRLETAG